MGKDVDGGNVGGENKQALLALTERLDDLLDAALELASLGRALDGLEHLFGQLLASKRRRDGRDGVEGDLELLAMSAMIPCAE